MRQIVLDTETTGLSPAQGHRVIEIGCVEMVKRRLTGNNFHFYLNPQRLVDPGAMRVHGIKDEFLKDKPLFSELAQDFWDYIQDAELIIHNAPFDLGFLNNEYRLLNNPAFTQIEKQCTIIDTLAMARKENRGGRNSLDALCKRYKINNEHRTLHGALLDSEILADVYLAMTGGQLNISLAEEVQKTTTTEKVVRPKIEANVRVVKANDADNEAHQAYLTSLEKSSGSPALWQKLEEAK